MGRRRTLDERPVSPEHGNKRPTCGGPVLDRYGNVIGVVSAKLDDSKAQLVNFAVNPTILEKLLKSSNVSWSPASAEEILDIPEIAQKASEFTVLIGCYE